MNADRIKSMLKSFAAATVLGRQMAGKPPITRGSGEDFMTTRHYIEGIGLFCKGFPVRVGDAGAKGRGIFATEAIAKGDVITLYPCDGMKIAYPDGQTALMADRRLSEEEQAAMHGHLLTEADGNAVEVVGDVTRPFVPHACGHLINDPHPCVDTILARPRSASEMWKAKLEYELRAVDAANCVFKPYNDLVVLCVATRDIAAGEEVLAPYGYAYWCKVSAFKLTRWFIEHFALLGRTRPRELDASVEIMRRFCKLLGQSTATIDEMMSMVK